MQAITRVAGEGLREIKTTRAGFVLGSVLEQSDRMKSPVTVRCYDRASGQFEREIHSVKDSYAFHGLNALRAYTIVAIDPLRKYNAVIQDNVVPK